MSVAAASAVGVACAMSQTDDGSGEDHAQAVGHTSAALTQGQVTLTIPEYGGTGYDCMWNQPGNLPPQDKVITARRTLPQGAPGWNFNVPANATINSVTISGGSSHHFDDAWALVYGPADATRFRTVVATDSRLASYLSGVPVANLTTSSIIGWNWDSLKGKAIDNDSKQPAWCFGASGASCTVPVTETYAPLSVNISNFSSVDAYAYPNRPTTRTFYVVALGDNNPDTDCRQTGMTITANYTY